MSFCSLQAGHGPSAGAIDYPLRELERDALEREIRRELDAFQGRHERTPDAGPEHPGDEFAAWALSDDSPLLLLNVEEFVLDPEAHLRTLAERVDGQGTGRRFTGHDFTGETGDGASRARRLAGELKTRLRTFAELDAERVLAAPRRRGTPKGRTRTHYVLLVSPPRDLTNAHFKRLIAGVISRRWPGAVAVGYIHRDTDNTHLHLWLSAETVSGKKIDVQRVTPSGDPVLDKYPDLDEEVARELSRYFGDPSIYEEHVAKKLEWVYWRERFGQAISRGERPPVMPFRARHSYDWVTNRSELVHAEKEGRGGGPAGAVRESTPAARAKSLFGALELWGKVEHLRVRVGYRRALLESLDGWGPLTDAPADSAKESFARELAQAEREYERHARAYARTLENRGREGYPAPKYPLHNARQIAEMREIARLTRDARLLRYVHDYELLDAPTDGGRLGRELGERWREEILARLEVAERTEQLRRMVRSGDHHREGDPAASRSGRAPAFDRDAEIVRGWLEGGWSVEQMNSSLGCFAAAPARYHAEQYVRAREYHEATKSVLADYGERDRRLGSRPVLNREGLERIEDFLAGDGEPNVAHDRPYWRDVAAYAAGEREATPQALRRLLAYPVSPDVRTHDRGSGDPLIGLGPLRPHDGRWAGRLRSLAELHGLEAAAAALEGASRERFERRHAQATALREALDLTRALKGTAGLTPDAPAGALNAEEGRRLARAELIISERLRSRGEGWEAWQVEAVRETARGLPAAERRRAERAAERASARLDAEQVAEEREALSSQLDAAARFFLASARRADGLETLRDPALREEYVSELTGRFAQVVLDGGHSPERLQLGEEELHGLARSTLAEGIARLEREEREAHELSRLEARMILADARLGAAEAERERFAAHAYFHRWSYKTVEGWASTSLAETRVAIGEAADPALVLVALDEERYLVPAINEVHERLLAEERARAAESEAAAAQYATAAGARSVAGQRPPAFTAEELERLEECARESRDPQLAQVISGGDEELFGAEYAARRALGRAVTAGVAADAERSLEAKYEHPFDPGRHPRLPAEVRAELVEALERHRAARETERSSSASYHEAWRARAEELKQSLSPERGSAIRPLLSRAEADETYACLGERGRAHLGVTMRGVEVMAEKSPRHDRDGAPCQRFTEWAARSFGGSAHLRHGYERGLGDTNIRGYGQAQREINRDRPSRSRPR